MAESLKTIVRREERVRRGWTNSNKKKKSIEIRRSVYEENEDRTFGKIKGQQGEREGIEPGKEGREEGERDGGGWTEQRKESRQAGRQEK